MLVVLNTAEQGDRCTSELMLFDLDFEYFDRHMSDGTETLRMVSQPRSWPKTPRNQNLDRWAVGCTCALGARSRTSLRSR